MTENPFRYGFRGYAAQRAAGAAVHQTSLRPAGVTPSMGGRPARGVAAQRTLEPVAKSLALYQPAASGEPYVWDERNPEWEPPASACDELYVVSVGGVAMTAMDLGWQPPDDNRIVNVDAVTGAVSTVGSVNAGAVRTRRGTLKPCPNCGIEYRRLDRHLVRCKA